MSETSKVNSRITTIEVVEPVNLTLDRLSGHETFAMVLSGSQPWFLRVGPLSYLVRLRDGEMWRRHIDHLRSGSDQPSDEDTQSIQLPQVVM